MSRVIPFYIPDRFTPGVKVRSAAVDEAGKIIEFRATNAKTSA
jgi:hypothetical protein